MATPPASRDEFEVALICSLPLEYDAVSLLFERNTQNVIMATPPTSRDEFEIAIICALPLEYNAVSLLFDQFWDENGDPYGRAIGDTNTYTTGRMGNFDVVLVLLPEMGEVSAASATASLRSSYTGLSLVLLTGICGGVPKSETGKEILLGDVIISKAVIQFDSGRQYPGGFVVRDTTEDSLGRPNKNIRTLVTILETDLAQERLERRAAVLLEQIQNSQIGERRRKADSYRYPGAANDKLFEASYRHKHHLLPQCLCALCHEGWDPVCDESRNLPCAVLGCDDGYVVQRQRLETNRQLEHEGRNREAQAPSIFIGRFGSSDKVLNSGEDRDQIAKRYGVLAFEMEGAGAWDEVPCIIVKGVSDYADSHKNKSWQDFAAATAASVTKGIVERYTQTDKSSRTQIRQQLKGILEDKESRKCLKDLRQTDPRDDKSRIQNTKGDLLKDAYRWILDHDGFKQWRDDPQYKLLWIKGY
ncbi:hypothetical protein TrVFT333_007152 [Trichoderma virens FT-333]|nr:hypothetical protein TrVFT333_007152 [Trichoderma virens FT-333]